jgi:hypothetical protein
MKFVSRRIINTLWVTLVAIVGYIAFEVIALSMLVQQYYSGWLLVLLMVALVAFYAKKRLSVIPLGRGPAWAQWHYCLGALFFFCYLGHVEFSLPGGFVEQLLSGLLWVVLISGVFGGIVNRVFARRLAYLGDEVIYERIPQSREQIKTDVENLIVASVEKSGSTTLSNYYIKNLVSYFSNPAFFLNHLLGSNNAFRRVQDGVIRQMRYMNKVEAEFAVTLIDFLQKKNILDIHFALQRILKFWGMTHFPVALVLMIVTLLHVVLVYAFRGAA